MSQLNLEEAQSYLRRRDPVLASLIARVGPCRLRKARSYFVALFEAVVWQQLSWQAASTIHQRLLATLGTRHPAPEDVLRVGVERLREAGLSRRKVEYLLDLARCFGSGDFPIQRIASMPDEAVVDELSKMRGIGRWSAEMFLMFALNRPDVFPMGDLGLRKAIQRCYSVEGPASNEQLLAIGDRWRPYRTVASWYLWACSDGTPLQEKSADR